MAAIEALRSLARWASVASAVVGFGVAHAADADSSISDYDADFIRQQLIPCWAFDPGVPHPEKYTVEVGIDVSPDGRITGAQLLDETRVSDPTYKSVAAAALRTVENPSCQPLRFPPGKYWPHLTVIFDLAKAINGDD
jgi:hypothetical protein